MKSKNTEHAQQRQARYRQKKKEAGYYRMELSLPPDVWAALERRLMPYSDFQCPQQAAVTLLRKALNLPKPPARGSATGIIPHHKKLRCRNNRTPSRAGGRPHPDFRNATRNPLQQASWLVGLRLAPLHGGRPTSIYLDTTALNSYYRNGPQEFHKCLSMSGGILDVLQRQEIADCRGTARQKSPLCLLWLDELDGNDC